jgi:hypothetical protein
MGNTELELERERSRTEGMILAKLESIESKLDSLTGNIRSLEERVNALENWRYKLIGASVVAGSLCSIGVSFALSYLP